MTTRNQQTALTLTFNGYSAEIADDGRSAILRGKAEGGWEPIPIALKIGDRWYDGRRIKGFHSDPFRVELDGEPSEEVRQ